MEKLNDLIFILEEQLRFIKMTVTEREYLENTINKLKTAINYTPCCKSDSELLKVLGEHIAEQFDHKAEDVIEQLEWKFKNL